MQLLSVCCSDPQKGAPSLSDSHSGGLALLQDPVLIASIGALVWCSLMIAAFCLFWRHSRTGCLTQRHGHGRAKGVA